jgi:hypothetical protein
MALVLFLPRACCLHLLAVFLMWCGPAAAVAGEPSKEFWPEIDFWFRFTPEWRVSVFTPISKNIETVYREGNIIAQVDYAWGTTTLLHFVRLLEEDRGRLMKALLVRGGYLGGRSLGDGGEAYTEYTAFWELHARTPVQGGVLISNRLRSDFRWLGDEPEFSARLRYRFMVEKEFGWGSRSVVPYGNVEAYYDSRYATVNRIRVIAGASVGWTIPLALEANITYQHDTRSSVTNLYALNVILHVFFNLQGKR